MIEYRTFRNDDPPLLVPIWNEACTGRGAVQMVRPTPFENYVFSKTYFDPAGLIVAVENKVPVGFAHAGFGHSPDQKKLDPSLGTVCFLGVRISHRKRGIGTELLRRSEAYLQQRGATKLSVGVLAPVDPFYFGLYGGSECPGVLESDALAKPFLLKQGYKIVDTRLVFHRRLDRNLNVTDGRFPSLRKRFEARIVLRNKPGTWWQECVLGPVELLEIQLEDRTTGMVVATVGIWEMQGFSHRWNESAVGLIQIEVRPDMRRQGLGKFLLSQIFKQVHEQYFTLIEAQMPANDAVGLALLRSAGFEEIDRGHLYRK